MKRKYRKIDICIWNDEKFCSLSDEAQLIFFFTFAHPNLTSLGAMRATIEGLASEKLMSKGYGKRYSKGLPKGYAKPYEELFRKGIVKYDEEHAFWWFPNFIKYNLPENQNVVKSWDNALYYLPECEMRNELIYEIQQLGKSKGYGKWLPKGFAIPLPKPFRKGMANGIGNQITDNREQITDIKESEPKKIFDYKKHAEEFYKSYPNRIDRKDTIESYQLCVKNINTHNEIMKAVENQKLEREYAVKYGVFYPEWAAPHRFIKKQKWKNEIKGEDYYRENSRTVSAQCKKTDTGSYSEFMQSTNEIIAESFD